MKKKWKIGLIVLIVLVAIRVALPTIVKKYVNKTLNELDGYGGSVDDIDLNLFFASSITSPIFDQKHTEQTTKQCLFSSNS